MLAGGTPVIVRCGMEDEFKMTHNKLRAAITPKTKWVIINSPSNPTGSVYSSEELEAITEVMHEFPHINVVTDDIYEHMIFDGIKFHTLAEIAPSLKSRIFTVNGVSKSYAMTGWRIGYGAGSKDIISAMTIIQSQSTSNPSSISQMAALEAISGPQDFIHKQILELQQKRNLVLSLLQEVKDMKFITPEGAFYVFPSCDYFFGKKTPGDKVINDSGDFCEYLLNNGVAVVPGSAFGLEGYFRISYALSKDVLFDACSRIIEACQKLV